MSSGYASFAPAAETATSKYPTPGRRRITPTLMPLNGVAILDKRDRVALLAPDRVSARRFLREEERL